MLRIRGTDGNIITLDNDHPFVEICDMDGKVACLVYQDNQGRVRQITKDTPHANRYKKMFGVEFCKIGSSKNLPEIQ